METHPSLVGKGSGSLSPRGLPALLASSARGQGYLWHLHFLLVAPPGGVLSRGLGAPSRLGISTSYRAVLFTVLVDLFLSMFRDRPPVWTSAVPHSGRWPVLTDPGIGACHLPLPNPVLLLYR